MDLKVLLSKAVLEKEESKRASRIASGVDLSKLVRMGFNEHPYGMSPKALEAILEASRTSNFYGDFQTVALKNAIADFYGLKFENVCTGAGSSPIIEMVGCAFLNPGDEVLMCPTFAAFLDMAGIRMAKPVVVPLNEDMTYDLDGLYAAITDRTKIIVVCNPNNPTGTYVGKQKLIEFIKKVPDDILILVDEAYLEFATADDCVSMYPLINEMPDKPIVVLKTFSKYYGMAGVRVGYALAQPDIIKALMKCTGSMVSRAGQAGAIAALADKEYYAEAKKKVVEGINYIEKELENMGCRVYHSQTNFIFFDTYMDAQEVRTKVMDAGIMISAPSISRVSVGRKEDNERFIEVMHEILGR